MSRAAPRLALARHAQPLVASGLCYGRTDLAADEAHTAQAAQALAAGWTERTLTVHVSPLRRCRQLAEALQRRRPQLCVVVDERLVEMDFGAWENRPWADIGRAELDAWTADFLHHRVGGHGESLHALLTRVAQAWGDWRRSGQDGLWITHAGVMHATQCIARHAGVVPDALQASEWPARSPPFGRAVWLPH